MVKDSRIKIREKQPEMSPKSHLRVITYCQTRGAECAKGFLFWFGITADKSCRKDGGKLKMDVATFTHYLELYGGWAVFIIVLLEYMNLPGGNHHAYGGNLGGKGRHQLFYDHGAFG